MVSTIRKNVEADGSLQRMFAVDENVEHQVHRRTDPIANKHWPRMSNDYGEENRHQFRRVQWKHEFSWTVHKVIAEEADWAGPTPLFFKNDVIEIVIHVD